MNGNMGAEVESKGEHKVLNCRAENEVRFLLNIINFHFGENLKCKFHFAGDIEAPSTKRREQNVNVTNYGQQQYTLIIAFDAIKCSA